MRLGVLLPVLLPAADDGAGGRGPPVDGTRFGSIFRMAIRISLRISESAWVAYALVRVSRAWRRRVPSAVSLARIAASVET